MSLFYSTDSITPPTLKFTIVWRGTETQIESPVGWENFSFTFVRGPYEACGYNKSIGMELKFVGIGLEILRKIFSFDGLDAEAYLLIYRLNEDDYGHDLEFKARLDFYSMKDFNHWMEIDTNQGENLLLYENKMEMVFETPLDDGEYISIPDGEIPDLLNAIVVEEGRILGDPSSDFSIYLTETPVTDTVEFFNTSQGSKSLFFKKKVLTPVTMRVIAKFKVSINVHSASGVDVNNLLLRVNFSGINSQHILHEIPVSLSSNSKTFEINFDKEVTISDNESYKMLCSLTKNDGGGIFSGTFGWSFSPIDPQEQNIIIEFIGQTKAYSFKGMPLNTLFKKLVDTTSDGKLGWESDLLTSGIGKDIYVTSGDAIRGFENATIKTSVKDLREAANTILAGASGSKIVNGKETVIFEDISYFYQDFELFDIGEVSNLKIYPDREELSFNRVDIGFPNKDYLERFGRDEFNVTMSYSLPVEGLEKTVTLDLISKIRADSYGIQFAKLESVKTKDRPTDNDVFFVHVKRLDNGSLIVNKDIKVDGGTKNPRGVFNVILSPKRCLLRHMRWLNSLCWFKLGKQIEFLSSERQDSNLNAEGIIEKDPVTMDNPQLFIPLYAEFDCAVLSSFNVASKLSSGQYGYVKFKWAGYPLKGWVFRALEKPSEQSVQRWQILLHHETPSNFLAELRYE